MTKIQTRITTKSQSSKLATIPQRISFNVTVILRYICSVTNIEYSLLLNITNYIMNTPEAASHLMKMASICD